jgi:hypothetical protein
VRLRLVCATAALQSRVGVSAMSSGVAAILPSAHPMQSVIAPDEPVAVENKSTQTKKHMPKFVIERTIPKLGTLTGPELHDISAKSCAVLRDLGPQIQWLHSYATDDKLYCIYIAPSAEMIREHGRRGGFPVDSVRQVKCILDPTVGE